MIEAWFKTLEGAEVMWFLLATMYLPTLLLPINFKCRMVPSLATMSGASFVCVALSFTFENEYRGFYIVNLLPQGLASLALGNYHRFKTMKPQGTIPLADFKLMPPDQIFKIHSYEVALDQAIEWTVGHGRHTAFYFFTPLYAKGNRRTVQAWLDGKVRAQSLAQYHGDGPIIERIKTPPSFGGKHPEAASAPAVLIHTDIERLKRLNLRAFFLMLTGPFWLTTLAYLP